MWMTGTNELYLLLYVYGCCCMFASSHAVPKVDSFIEAAKKSAKRLNRLEGEQE